jgi:hypothetical protein
MNACELLSDVKGFRTGIAVEKAGELEASASAPSTLSVSDKGFLGSDFCNSFAGFGSASFAALSSLANNWASFSVFR